VHTKNDPRSSSAGQNSSVSLPCEVLCGDDDVGKEVVGATMTTTTMTENKMMTTKK
jgi:hypothetical protein